MADRAHRILMVGPFPPVQGGVTTFMLNVLSSHLAERYDFSPFTTSRPPKKDVSDNYGYAAVFNAGFARFLLGGSITAWHLLRFPFSMLARRVDLVQIQTSDWLTFWESALYVLMALALGKPTLLRLGGTLDAFYESSSSFPRWLIRRVLRLPRALIVQSQYWRAVVARLGRTHDVYVVNNFVHDSAVTPRQDPGNAVPRFLFSAGSEARRKGVEDLLDAIRLLQKERLPVSFCFVATPPSLKARVHELGLSKVVHTRGQLDRADMLAEYRSSDAFLLPSRGEGFPNALLEAMSCGLPIIATPVGAIPELLEDGRGGYIVPVGDPRLLSRRIAELASDPLLRRSMGALNQDRILQRYTASRVLPALESAYGPLLSGRTRPSMRP